MESPGIKLNEATHKTVLVDKNQFIDLIHYFAKNNLVDGFNSYLEKNNTTHLEMDKDFANHLKKFLLTERHVKDETPRNAIQCGCGIRDAQ